MPENQHSEDLSDDLGRVGRGDRTAFRRVYRSSSSKLFHICLRITRDRAAAEDVLQDVYIKIWRSAETYDPARSSALSWLGKIARNSAIDWYRSRANRPLPRDADTFLTPGEPEPVDQRMIREHSEKSALSLIGELNADDEEQLRTIYFQGLTYAQLAEQNGVPLGTVKSRVRRALIKLRQKLNDE